MAVELPRADSRGVSPRRARLDVLTVRLEHIRHDHRYRAALALICLHVFEPLGVELLRVELIAGRVDEHLRVSGPAKTLVALRAVGRNIHKIALLSPDHVVEQPIQLAIPEFSRPMRRISEQITSRGNSLNVERVKSLYLKISEAVEAQLGLQHSSLPPQIYIISLFAER